MSWYEELDVWTADYLPDMAYEKDVPLRRYTSFRIGGAARRMAFPRSGEELVLLVSRALELGARPFVLGNGTNVLFPDEGVDRLVISTREMNRVCRGENENEIIAECGASMANMAVFAQKEGLSGLEFAHGIPGSVGGGVTMNAGAYGGELAQVIESVTVLFPDEGVRTLNAGEMAFSYRHSLLTERPEAVVLRAAFRLQPGKPEEIRKKMDELMARRKASQPLEYPSAGSTFKRPEGYFAGALIEGAGLKGLRVGGAQVSEKHAGFIVNVGSATAGDILELIARVQRAVLEKDGVALETEVRVVGEEPDI